MDTDDSHYKEHLTNLGNFGCEKDAEATITYDVEVTDVTFSDNWLVVHLKYMIGLSVSNVNYTASGITQDPSAYWVFYDSLGEQVESLRTFAARKDCETISNSISGEAEVRIFTSDDFVLVQPAWSGIRSDGSRWNVGDTIRLHIPEEMLPSPPQNLQVTFNVKKEGVLSGDNLRYYRDWVKFTPVVDRFSNVDWADAPMGQCSFQITILDETRKINLSGGSFCTLGDNRQERAIEFNNFGPANGYVLSNFINEPKYANRNYCIKVEATNSAGLHTAPIYSPVFTTPPPQMSIAEPIRTRTDDGKTLLTLRYGIAPNAGARAIHYSITPTVNGVEQTSLAVTGTVPAGTVEGLPMSASTRAEFVLPANCAVNYVARCWLEGYESMLCETTGVSMDSAQIAPDLSYELASDNSGSVTITATLNGQPQVCVWQAGYAEGDESIVSVNDYDPWVKEIEPARYRAPSDKLTIVGASRGHNVYVCAFPKSSEEYGLMQSRPNYGRIIVPISDTIYGIVKTCDETKNIVDIVESKGGILTPSWTGGQKVRVIKKCEPGPGVFNISSTTGLPASTKIMGNTCDGQSNHAIAGLFTCDERGFFHYTWACPGARFVPNNVTWTGFSDQLARNAATTALGSNYVLMDFSTLKAGIPYNFWVETISGPETLPQPADSTFVDIFWHSTSTSFTHTNIPSDGSKKQYTFRYSPDMGVTLRVAQSDSGYKQINYAGTGEWIFAIRWEQA